MKGRNVWERGMRDHRILDIYRNENISVELFYVGKYKYVDT